MHQRTSAPAQDDQDAGDQVQHRRRQQPEWFEHRQFQYNGRLVLPFLPGLVIMVYLGGEVLLGIASVGACLIHILDSVGQKRNALIAYVLTFVCCQMTIFYSAVPLVWHSFFNVCIISALNMHAVMTGGWILLQFDILIAEEPELAKIIEIFLFTVYPFVSTVLLTWMTATMIEISIAPICFCIIGFILLQPFMVPTRSSFTKDTTARDPKGQVLEPETVALVLLAYLTTPPMVQVAITAWEDRWSLLHLQNIICLIFLVFLSLFLGTFLSIKQVLDYAGIQEVQLGRLRWFSLGVVLTLLNNVLGRYEMSSYLLPWLPVGIGLHAVFAITLQRRKHLPLSWLVFGCLLFYYAVIFYLMPWRLVYYLPRVGLHIDLALLLVLLSIAFTLLTTLAAVGDIFGLVIILCASVFVMCEVVLQAGHLYSAPLLAVSGFLASYAVIKLYHAGKIAWFVAWLVVSIQFVKVPSVTHLYRVTSEWTLMMSVQERIGVLLTALVVTKIHLFEKRKQLSMNVVLAYFISTGLAVALNVQPFLQPLLHSIVQEEPDILDVLGTVFLLWGLLLLKLTMFHTVSAPVLRHLAPALLLMGIAVLDSPWMLGLVVSLYVTVIAVSQKWTSRSALLRAILAICVGIPVGMLVVLYFTEESVVGPGIWLATCALSFLVTFSFLTVYESNKNCDMILTYCWVLITILDVVLLALDASVWGLKGLGEGSALHISSFTWTGTAAVFKLHATKNKSPDLLSGAVSGPPWVPLFGNLATLASFISLCLASDPENMDGWILGCSAVFLLLQNDGICISSLHHSNQKVPTVCTAAVYILAQTVWASNIWLPKKTFLRTLQGALESAILLLTLPVLLAYCTTAWSGKKLFSNKLIAFLLPLFSLLILFGSSFYSTVYSGIGLLMGGWVLTIKT
ncbi:uncharacterized protein LOC106174833 [Lingula anatina]|uniref:Uncharacterized protein LOC106174833 n=1 Tax=Lingula anatina TaxID=7574 RepID=A0A1S3JNM9_LINAN|nr:uncharacterized protein LOC106174833 [Lingula anatina]|eukprot:XP_013411980.1 uncharacterized protein LOC106174833 [Lingula anatina]